jgi:Pvc16 N-terminal domain
MPYSSVIAATPETLQTMLTNALSTLTPGPPIAELHDLQGTISTNPARLTIFLFDAAEDPSARNRPRVRGVAPPDVTLKKPPMALLLRYLLTPWSRNRLTDHTILGRAMQVLYDGKAKCGHCHQPLFTGRPVPARLAGLLRSRNREPTIVEPVSAPPKRKLENRHQRPEPETRTARAEMPEIADHRLGHPSLTCGNVGDSPPPGNNTPAAEETAVREPVSGQISDRPA